MPTLGKSPLILSGQGDNVDSDKKWKVIAVRGVATGSGKFILTDGAGGRVLWESASLSAGESDETHFDQHWWDSIYLSQTPGGNCYIYYA